MEDPLIAFPVRSFTSPSSVLAFPAQPPASQLPGFPVVLRNHRLSLYHPFVTTDSRSFTTTSHFHDTHIHKHQDPYGFSLKEELSPLVWPTSLRSTRKECDRA